MEGEGIWKGKGRVCGRGEASRRGSCEKKILSSTGACHTPLTALGSNPLKRRCYTQMSILSLKIREKLSVSQSLDNTRTTSLEMSSMTREGSKIVAKERTRQVTCAVFNRRFNFDSSLFSFSFHLHPPSSLSSLLSLTVFHLVIALFLLFL